MVSSFGQQLHLLWPSPSTLHQIQHIDQSFTTTVFTNNKANGGSPVRQSVEDHNPYSVIHDLLITQLPEIEDAHCGVLAILSTTHLLFRALLYLIYYSMPITSLECDCVSRHAL